jgi:tRNA-dihydrouridine synthase
MVDAVDLNLGCPQGIAKKGRYGSFLMEEWDLIHALIRKLHDHLSVPVTAKFRVYETVEKTVEYARMLEDAGAQILCCHGRLREMKGQFTVRPGDSPSTLRVAAKPHLDPTPPGPGRLEQDQGGQGSRQGARLCQR